MEVQFKPGLTEYMEKTGKRYIMVEVIQTQNSDFDVTEICPRFVSEKFAVSLKEKKRYRAVAAPIGEVLMPPYRLEIDSVVTFELKSFLFIKWIRQEGINL